MREEDEGGILGVVLEAPCECEGVDAVGLVLSVSGLSDVLHAVCRGSVDAEASGLEHGRDRDPRSSRRVDDEVDGLFVHTHRLDLPEELVEALGRGSEAEASSDHESCLAFEDDDVVCALSSEVDADDESHRRCSFLDEVGEGQ